MRSITKVTSRIGQTGQMQNDLGKPVSSVNRREFCIAKGYMQTTKIAFVWVVGSYSQIPKLPLFNILLSAKRLLMN